ncbi:GNAT family N-acetyltransferase [Lysinibacillus sp. fls2-241-R2A-57]|uniref:GNAT family N-acetyltransferase n=1 Tax=Lysinibacillus sp. fls2-241-R2A-57 TaxID=3040292 RepID=UPI0025532796|nr:GNAT family N-acetyltransferase [Lysinibacillus sp. fls2-241-R2A-57]
MEICTVTLATVGEVVPLFNAYREFYGQQASLEQAEQFLTERLNKGESVIFLAYLDAQPVGFVQLYPVFSSVAMKKAFILNDLFVAEHARKRGVAQGLIEQCYSYCLQKDARYIALETATDNVRAQKLYEKLGMKIDDGVFRFIKYW